MTGWTKGVWGVVAGLLVAGCNTASMDDLRRVEAEVADLRTRLEAAEERAELQAERLSLSSDSALDSASQCNLVCQQVSDRLDRLYLESTPR